MYRAFPLCVNISPYSLLGNHWKISLTRLGEKRRRMYSHKLQQVFLRLICGDLTVAANDVTRDW